MMVLKAAPFENTEKRMTACLHITINQLSTMLFLTRPRAGNGLVYPPGRLKKPFQTALPVSLCSETHDGTPPFRYISALSLFFTVPQ
ncbi:MULTISPECIES: hypothetical protein [unclassified Neisseria]|uniref:hypothetical protein n=1 Tax=unclassified Neisseria TaxID=2623750 RepID=UPI001071D27A|nr:MULTISPECIES: hypothetical protein [unclassified Neisseria]MBF0804475.1 hypothetical protein [Neisseria sp. 19428wB4_WF04]TFU40541.1 hypothetical protein E4T99_08985 [Neisseria sp. WF04]